MAFKIRDTPLPHDLIASGFTQDLTPPPEIGGEPWFGPECTACQRSGIRGYGNPFAGVVFVGIAPGRDEMRTGRPFQGPAGRLLNNILKATNWVRDEAYCTNLICWWNDAPGTAEIGHCAGRLFDELTAIKPKVVIPLGAIPTSTWTTRPLGQIRGCPFKWTIPGGEHETIVMPTYHPAAVLRGQPALIHDIWRDFNKIKWLLDYGLPPAPIVHEVETHEEGQRIFDMLGSRDATFGLPRMVAIDVETSSASADTIDVFQDKLLCLAVATELYPHELGGDGVDPATVDPVEKLETHAFVFPGHGFEHPYDWHVEDVNWIGHNMSFDRQVIKRHLDIDLPIAEDTMLMSYSVDERAGQHGLKKLVREFCGADFYEEAMGSYRKGGMDKVPKDTLYRYNGLDAGYTYQLHGRLRALQEEEGTRGVYTRLLVPAANAFSDIQYRGIFIDPGEVNKLEIDWYPRWLAMDDELIAIAQAEGFPGEINLNSPKQLAHFLYDILHLQPGPLALGTRTTKAEVLEALAGAHPFIDKLLARRKLDHMISTYLMGIKDDIRFDSRVHPTAMIHGTVTGRIAFHDPPMQLIPKAVVVGDDYARIRNMFAATNENYFIAEADHSQIELWVAQAVSGDEVMLEDLQSGDFHSYAASTMFHIPLEDILSWSRDDPRRELARFNSKFITYGTMYGRGEASVAAQLKCSLMEAITFVRGFFSRYQRYSEWWHDTQKKVLTEAELTSLTGRKRRFRITLPGADRASALRQAVNFPIQGPASDYTLYSIIKLHQLLREQALDSYVLWGNHDSGVFEVSRRHGEEVLELIKTTMTEPKLGLPSIPVEIKIGPNLGACKLENTRAMMGAAF